jgi:transposase
MPWATGKSPITTTYAWFLASWAKVLSWTETARRFRASWHVLFNTVHHAVEWGRAHQNLDGVRSIGVDELSWKKGHKYLTLVYQIDHGCRRLLWIGRDRTAATFECFFDWLGEPRSRAIEFIASDMWKAFLGTAAKRASAAVHVLDRFHVMKLFSDAVDKVRRVEARSLRERGDKVTLTKTRWVSLKRQHRLTEPQHGRLAELLRANLRTGEHTSQGGLPFLLGLHIARLGGTLPRPMDHRRAGLASSRSRSSPAHCGSTNPSCSTGSEPGTPSRWAPSRASTTRPA